MFKYKEYLTKFLDTTRSLSGKNNFEITLITTWCVMVIINVIVLNVLKEYIPFLNDQRTLVILLACVLPPYTLHLCRYLFMTAWDKFILLGKYKEPASESDDITPKEAPKSNELGALSKIVNLYTTSTKNAIENTYDGFIDFGDVLAFVFVYSIVAAVITTIIFVVTLISYHPPNPNEFNLPTISITMMVILSIYIPPIWMDNIKNLGDLIVDIFRLDALRILLINVLKINSTDATSENENTEVYTWRIPKCRVIEDIIGEVDLEDHVNQPIGLQSCHVDGNDVVFKLDVPIGNGSTIAQGIKK